MLLSLSLLLLVACIFGYKQSIALKRSNDLNNKQGLELALVRSQYTHNLSTLSEIQAEYNLALNSVDRKNNQIASLQDEIENLKIDLECSQDHQIDEDKFQEVVESHIVHVLNSICLQSAYENACSYHDLEISIEYLVK